MQQEELPVGTVDAPMSAASSSAYEVATPRDKRKRTTEPVEMQAKVEKEAADINAFEAGIPTGIRFLTIQGMRGSGCATAGATMREFFTDVGVPVINIDVNSFLEADVDGCHTCERLEDDVSGEVGHWPRYCADCPSALKTESLYAHIIERAKVLAASASYATNGDQGLIVRQVRHATGLIALYDVISKRKQWWSFHLQPPNSTMCKIRHLRSLGQWEHDETIAALPAEMPEREMLERSEVLLIPHMKKSCWSLLREYEHYEYFAEAYRLGAEWVIDIDDKSPEDVATTIQAQMILKKDDDHEEWKLPGHVITSVQAPSASARTAEGTPIVDPITVAPGATASRPVPDIDIDPADATARLVSEVLSELLPARPGLTSRRDVDAREAAASSSASPPQPSGWVSSDVRVTRPAVPAPVARATLRPNTPRAPWSDRAYVHPRTITATIPLEGETVTRNMPSEVYNCGTTNGRNYRGVYHDAETWNLWSRRLNWLLRHNITFPMNPQGFAVAEDIVYALETGRHRSLNAGQASLPSDQPKRHGWSPRLYDSQRAGSKRCYCTAD